LAEVGGQLAATPELETAGVAGALQRIQLGGGVFSQEHPAGKTPAGIYLLLNQ